MSGNGKAGQNTPGQNTRASRLELAMADALAKLLIEKDLITREDFMEKLSADRGAYQKLLNPTVQ
jgi:hypothetical protein